MTLLLRSSRRYLLRHPWQIGLSVLGVAIAVAVVVGVDLANASARRAFTLSVEGVAGRATHEITGGPRGLDEEVYARLRRAGWRQSAPVVEGWLASPLLAERTRSERPLRLFGIDPFAETLFRDFTRDLRAGQREGDLGRFLTDPAAALVTVDLAAELGLAVGDELPVDFAGRRHRLELIGLIEPESDLARRASRDLVVVDVATAQEVLGSVGRLSRVDLLIADPATAPASADAIAEWLPEGVELHSKEARSGALDQMTRAFRLNLQALSLLALVVGMFLIYNTMTFSVVERRSLIGTLRAMGVTRREIFMMVVAEAVLVALAGSAAGLAIGIFLARGLVDLVAQTINDLYFVVSVTGVELPLSGLIKGAFLGTVGTVLAALGPAREATSAPPRAILQRSLLERRARRSLPVLTAGGAAVLLLAAALLALPSKSIALAFGGVFLVILGGAALVPGTMFVAMRLLRPLLARSFGLLGSLAARGVAGTLSRTGVATAALTVAVAMTVGVGIMVGSFRLTLIDWLEQTLRADVYAAPVDINSRGEARNLDPRVIETLRAAPGIGAVTTYRRARVDSPEGRVSLTALDLERPGFAVFRFTAGDAGKIWESFVDGAVIVSESFAFHRDLAVGDRIELSTDRGPRDLEIAGVYYDYASDRGTVSLHRAVYDRFFDDRAVQSMGLYLAPGVDSESLIADLRRRVGGHQELTLAANRELRRSALEIFDRTFVITAVLRLLAVAVAFIGVLAALMALQLERARELAVLRANGLTPGQVWGLVTTQTGLMGWVAGVLAVPLGIVLALLLIEVINRRSFGWTLRFDPSPEVLLQAVLLGIFAALLAGFYPAFKMARSSPALALREE